GLVTPLYRGIRESCPEIKPFDWRLDVPMGPARVTGSVLTHEVEKGLTIYFIDKPEYFDRGGLYNERGVDYPDNAERFIFFTKAIAPLARYLPWQPEVLHAHDWPTALLPAIVREEKNNGGWINAPPACFTIHNLAYQGNFPGAQFDLTNLPPIY